MTDSTWKLEPADGELTVLTGVAGPAAKMGHRLTIAMQSWHATVDWRGKAPGAVLLEVDVDSLQVLQGEGGVTPLSGPEKGIVRANALKSLDAKKFPKIRFTADDIAKTAGGYRLTGTVEIHGTSRPQVVDLAVGEDGGDWVMSAEVPVTQSDFKVKPYSLLMGTMKVADEVTVRFSARHPK